MLEYETEWRALQSKRKSAPSVRGLMRSAALHGLGLVSRASGAPSLRLLYCHYVFNDQVSQFAAKLRYLSTIGSFVSAQEVVNIASGIGSLERPCFHLSFDDGFRNIITNALPVLRDLGIPATFFVPTAVIGADEDRVRNFCINVTNHPGVIELASWDELGRAQEQGLEMASHTRNHVRLSEISSDSSRLQDELFGSRQDLERHLGLKCRYISWPYGRVSDIDEVALSCIRSAGFEACFGAFRGRIERGVTDRFYLPRHHFEAQWPLNHVKYFALGGMERANV